VYPPADATVPTVTDYNWYNLHSGLRPGAFVGWKADVFYKYHVPAPGAVDERTGLANCPFKCYEAICNWHAQLLFDWMLNNATLLESIRFANDSAMSSSPPVKADLKTYIPPADGTAPTFDTFLPRTCLRVYGYGDLKFNY